jgi:fructose transport system substrate-binding protein
MQMRTRSFVGPRSVIAAAFLLVVGLVSGCTAERHWGGSSRTGEGGKIKIGLVTKTESNPYFVKLRDAARASADAHGAEVLALAGKFDGDNEGQVTAIENLVRQGVSGILITPSSTGGVLGAIKSARQQGVIVIALDTATEPETVVDATFATNNKQAGVLLGQYIKARMGNTPPQILAMDLDPSASVGIARHNGFLEGMGLPLDTPAVIGSALTQGDQSKAQQAMENLLQRSAAQVNVVYNINEPAARGAYQALAGTGLTSKVLVGAIDGSCSGVADVKAGKFVATVMQFPKKMAEDGVSAVVDAVHTGKSPSGFHDTGATLITDQPIPGIASQDSTWGAANCWG